MIKKLKFFHLIDVQEGPRGFYTGNLSIKYRVRHLVADLGWVDFVFGCSTVSQILLGKIRISQYWHRSRARWCATVNIIVNLTQVRDQMPLPVLLFQGLSH